MNPSTDDMLKAIDEVHADTVFILPNNKNIVLAANQAKHLVEDKEIIVIPQPRLCHRELQQSSTSCRMQMPKRMKRQCWKK